MPIRKMFPRFYIFLSFMPFVGWSHRNIKLGSFTARALFYLDLSYTFLCDWGNAIPIGCLIHTTTNRVHVVSDSGSA